LKKRIHRVGQVARDLLHPVSVGVHNHPEGRWRVFTYDEIIARDKASLDIFWLRDESLEDSASLPDPHIIAAEIAEDLRASLEQIEDVLADLQARAGARSQDG
jgi:type I restriction enzyme M protein